MNFLEIARRTRRESSATASASDAPVTVVGQTGQLKQIVDWCSEAYHKIQRSSNDWRWLRSRFSLQTVASTDTYAYGDATDVAAAAAITRFRQWLPFTEDGLSNVSCYLTSTGVAGERYLTPMSWPDFRARYKFGAQSDGQPINFTISPANELMLGPKPDAIYTVLGEYQKSNQILALDADTPEMPEDYHMLIVWYALKSYAAYAPAPEVWTRAEDEAGALFTALNRSQLPAFRFG